MIPQDLAIGLLIAAAIIFISKPILDLIKNHKKK